MTAEKKLPAQLALSEAPADLNLSDAFTRLYDEPPADEWDDLFSEAARIAKVERGVKAAGGRVNPLATVYTKGMYRVKCAVALVDSQVCSACGNTTSSLAGFFIVREHDTGGHTEWSRASRADASRVEPREHEIRTTSVDSCVWCIEDWGVTMETSEDVPEDAGSTEVAASGPALDADFEGFEGFDNYSGGALP